MEQLLQQFASFLNGVGLAGEQLQTAQTYIEIIRINCGSIQEKAAAQGQTNQLLLSKQSSDDEMLERIAKLKQNLKHQAQIIENQRQTIHMLESRKCTPTYEPSALQVGNSAIQPVEASFCQTSLHMDAGFGASGQFSRPDQSLAGSLGKSALFQHEAVAQHNALRYLLQQNPWLTENVWFNDILNQIARQTDVIFAISRERRVVRVLEGVNQYSNMLYIYLNGGQKSYGFQDEQDKIDGGQLVVYTEEEIQSVICKNLQLQRLYLLGTRCQQICGKAAEIEELYCDEPRLLQLSGLDRCRVIGCQGSVSE